MSDFESGSFDAVIDKGSLSNAWPDFYSMLHIYIYAINIFFFKVIVLAFAKLVSDIFF